MCAALEVLYGRGAHFVLCRGKRPIWKGWLCRRPPLEAVAAHGPELGIIPSSIGTSALDVDRGDVDRLAAETVPLVTLKTPRGHHCYYYDEEERPNSHWYAHGCYGDVRSAHGFLRVYEGGIERLAGALSSTPSDAAPFPIDVLQATERRSPCSPLSMERPRAINVKTPEDLPALEAVQEGARNISLFDHVRFEAYRQDKECNFNDWAAWLLEVAREGNARFAKPLPDSEVRSVAQSISTWTWSGGGPIDHSASAQRRRGIKSGWARRRRTADRDKAIVAAVEAGKSMRAVATAHRLSVGAIHGIVKRHRSRQGVQRTFSGGVCSVEIGEPNNIVYHTTLTVRRAHGGTRCTYAARDARIGASW